MRKIFFGVLAALTFVGCDKEYDAPAGTRAAFAAAYPTAVDVEWEREHGYAVAEFEIPGVSNDCEAWYTLDGVWVLTSYEIAYSALPQAVRTAFEAEYGKLAPIDDVRRIERNAEPTIYFIETTVVVNGMLTDIYIDYLEDGTVLRTSVEVEDFEPIYYYL